MFNTNNGPTTNDTMDDDGEGEENIESLSTAPILLTDQGYMYYVTEVTGQCRIYEILP